MIRLETWHHHYGLSTTLHHDDAYEDVLRIFNSFRVDGQHSHVRAWYVDSDSGEPPGTREEVVVLEYKKSSRRKSLWQKILAGIDWMHIAGGA